jgi:hypothetical protein
MTSQQQTVTYTQQGTLGPLTLQECRVLRDYLNEPDRKPDKATEETVTKFLGYLQGLIETNQSVGTIV